MAVVITKSAPFNNPTSGPAYEAKINRYNNAGSGFRPSLSAGTVDNATVTTPWPTPTLLLKLVNNLDDSSPNRLRPINSPVSNLGTGPVPGGGFQSFVPGNNNELVFADDRLFDLDTGDWTMSMLVKPYAGPGIGSFPCFASKGGIGQEVATWTFFVDDSNDGLGFAMTKSLGPTVVLENSRTTFTVPYTFWHRIVAVRRGSIVSVYANGDVYGPFDVSTMPAINNTASLVIGDGDDFDNTGNYSGDIADFVFIKGTALTDAQIVYLQTTTYPYP